MTITAIVRSQLALAAGRSATPPTPALDDARPSLNLFAIHHHARPSNPWFTNDIILPHHQAVFLVSISLRRAVIQKGITLPNQSLPLRLPTFAPRRTRLWSHTPLHSDVHHSLLYCRRPLPHFTPSHTRRIILTARPCLPLILHPPSCLSLCPLTLSRRTCSSIHPSQTMPIIPQRSPNPLFRRY